MGGGYVQDYKRGCNEYSPTMPNCSDKDFTSSAFAPCRAAAEEERRPLGVALGSSVVVEGGSVVVPSGAGGVSATSSDMLGR